MLNKLNIPTEWKSYFLKKNFFSMLDVVVFFERKLSTAHKNDV